jgi:hypothetical protein
MSREPGAVSENMLAHERMIADVGMTTTIDRQGAGVLPRRNPGLMCLLRATLSLVLLCCSTAYAAETGSFDPNKVGPPLSGAPAELALR